MTQPETAEANPAPAPRRRWLRAIELALWVAGSLAVGGAARSWLDGVRYQAEQERLLEASLLAADLWLSEPVVVPGDVAFAQLSVHRLGMSVMVDEGVDAATLRRAAGRIPGTAKLGDGGNVGLAGHRDTFFRPLRRVEVGDQIVLTWPQGRETYRVEWVEVVSPQAVEVLRPTPYPALTLVTCYPFGFVGPAPQRFVVRARLVERQRARNRPALDRDPARGR